MAPELSVIVPACNEESTIGRQLDALLSQIWEGSWEVIVVDNRSTDRTATIARERSGGAVPVRVVAAMDAQGLNHARNAGVAASEARSVAFCDADDIVAPGWIAAMGDALRAAPLVSGVFELDRLNPRWLADSRGRGDERSLARFAGLFPVARGGNLGIRRDLLVELGGFDEDPQLAGADDVELSLRASVRGVTPTAVPDAVVHYRYREGAADLWRQGRTYGRARPLIRRRLLELGRPAPSPFSGWRSWLWLLAHVPDLRTTEGRAAWVWVAGNRLGQLTGSVRHRCLML